MRLTRPPLSFARTLPCRRLEPLKMSHVESLLSSNQKDVLMEEIIANYHANTKDAGSGAG
ncbi:phosphate acetyltransferase [Salmonella enterica subsp. enterica]|uniref:Phosphate acetyltransferase n=1 Tax=Salmonella enterica I TaxID=59201 RepID=A0A3S4LTY2_SALET|nr:phosphate acetyltransferase [Salmonella enterica subsp. enterica]